MKTITSTLKLDVERWDDPGGPEPNGAGSPVASYDFVAGVSGEVIVELTREEAEDIGEGLEAMLGEKWRAAVADYIADNPGEVDHGYDGLSVSKWAVQGVTLDRVTLSVEEFIAEPPGPPEREYDPDEEYERRGRRIRPEPEATEQ